MAVKYKYLPVESGGSTVEKLIARKNSPKLPGGILGKVMLEYEDANPGDPGVDIFIPILPPFHKKYNNLLDREEFAAHLEKREAEIEAATYVPPEIPLKENPPSAENRYEEPEIEVEPEPEPEPEPEFTPIIREAPKPKRRPVKEIKKPGGLKFEEFPYTFSRPGETIEAVIRLYNDMSVSREIINKLVYEFSQLNPDANPPKLGQTVQIPVLLPFTYRHLNKNKIFTDE